MAWLFPGIYSVKQKTTLGRCVAAFAQRLADVLQDWPRGVAWMAGTSPAMTQKAVAVLFERLRAIQVMWRARRWGSGEQMAMHTLTTTWTPATGAGAIAELLRR